MAARQLSLLRRMQVSRRTLLREDRARAAREGREGAGVAARRRINDTAARMRAELGLEPDHRLASGEVTF